MISDKKLVYDNRTSLSDDESFTDSNSDDEPSDGIYASRVHKTARKTNLHDDDKKFFTSLPTCYSIFQLLICKMSFIVIALLQNLTNVGMKRMHW